MSVGPKNRRRDVRRELPQLTIQFGAVKHATRDWSLGGFALRDVGQGSRIFEPEDEVSGIFAVQDGDSGYRFTASVVRASHDTGVVAFRFLELAPDSFAVLERLLLRAQPVPGSADRDDQPVGQASAKPAPDGVSNWFTRWRSRLVP